MMGIANTRLWLLYPFVSSSVSHTGGEGKRVEVGRKAESWQRQAQWKLPALFCNDWACLTLAQALRDRPDLGHPKTAYGATACSWAGGRIPVVSEQPPFDEVRARFEAYRELGMDCSLTFNLSHVDAVSLEDGYCNTLLDLIEEQGGSVIVADEGLAHHIRATHPHIHLVASIIRTASAWIHGYPGCTGEEDFYRRTLERFDEVVVRCAPGDDLALFERIADIASRCQVLVNQTCPSTCPLYEQHVRRGEEALVRGEDVSNCLRAESGDATRRLPSDQVRELVNLGFVKLKISGRHLKPYDFVREVLLCMAGEDSADPRGFLTSSQITALRLMPALDAFNRARIALPEPADYPLTR